MGKLETLGAPRWNFLGRHVDNDDTTPFDYTTPDFPEHDLIKEIHIIFPTDAVEVYLRVNGISTSNYGYTNLENGGTTDYSAETEVMLQKTDYGQSVSGHSEMTGRGNRWNMAGSLTRSYHTVSRTLNARSNDASCVPVSNIRVWTDVDATGKMAVYGLNI